MEAKTKVCVVWSWTITRSVKNKNETTRQNSRHIASRHIHTHTQGTRTPGKASTVQGREDEKKIQHGEGGGGRSISRRLLGHMHNTYIHGDTGLDAQRHAHYTHIHTHAHTHAHIHTHT